MTTFHQEPHRGEPGPFTGELRVVGTRPQKPMGCTRYDFNPVGGMVASNRLSEEACVGFGVDIQIVRPPHSASSGMSSFFKAPVASS